MSESSTDIFVFGSGGHAEVAIGLLESLPEKKSLKIVAEDMQALSAAVREWPNADVITQVEFDNIPFFSDFGPGFHVAIGDNSVRMRLAKLALNKGLSPVSIISSTAAVSQFATLGVGVFVGPNSHVGPGAKVGDFSIVNSLANLEHRSILGSYSHLAPGACVCGNAEIGEGSFVGANSVVKEGTRLGKWSTLGALSFLNFEHSESYSVLVGCPAVQVKAGNA